MFKNHLGGTDFDSMKGSWRAAEAWHCERPGKDIGKDAASVATGSPGLHRSCKVEVWHHEGSVQGLLLKPSCNKRSQHIGITKSRSSSRMESTRA